MKILLAAGGNPQNWPQSLLSKYDAYVGIDRGALYLLQAGYPVDLAVGDFDSLSNEEQRKYLQKPKSIPVPCRKRRYRYTVRYLKNI